MATAGKYKIGSIGLYTSYQDAKDDIDNYSDTHNLFLKKFSTYTCRNVFSYAKEPSRGSEFDLINDEETVKAKYVPTVSFTFNAIDPDIYSWFIKVVNTRGFFVRYYDYEIQKDVIRKMYMSEKELSKVQFASPNVDGSADSDTYKYGYILRLVGLTVTFVSHFGYDSYEELSLLDKSDDRFMTQLSVPRLTLDGTTLYVSHELDTGTASTSPLIYYSTDGKKPDSSNSTLLSMDGTGVRSIDLSSYIDTTIFKFVAKKEDYQDSYTLTYVFGV